MLWDISLEAIDLHILLKMKISSGQKQPLTVYVVSNSLK